MLCKTILFSILSTLTLVAAQGSCPGDKPKSLCCYRKVNNVGEEFSTKDRSADGSLREDQTLEAKLKEHNLPNDTPSNAGCFTWEQCKALRFKEKPYDVCCTDTYADPAMLNVTPDMPVVGLNCAQRVEEKPSVSSQFFEVLTRSK